MLASSLYTPATENGLRFKSQGGLGDAQPVATFERGNKTAKCSNGSKLGFSDRAGGVCTFHMKTLKRKQL